MAQLPIFFGKFNVLLHKNETKEKKRERRGSHKNKSKHETNQMIYEILHKENKFLRHEITSIKPLAPRAIS